MPDIDEAIHHLDELVAVRTETHNLTKTSLADTESKIRSSIAGGSAQNVTDLALLYARKEMVEKQLHTATSFLLDAQRKLELAKEAKVNMQAQSILRKAQPHIHHTGSMADTEINATDNKFEEMSEYTSTLSSEAVAETSDIMARAMEEATKTHTHAQQNNPSSEQSIDTLADPPTREVSGTEQRGGMRETRRRNGIVYSTI
jgi:hypothetical protein